MQFRKAKRIHLIGDTENPRWLYVTISLHSPTVITGLTPPAGLSPAFNEITLRDKAVTTKTRKQYLTMGWAKIKIHYSQSGLAKFLHVLFFLPLADRFNILHFWQCFAFFWSLSTKSFKCCLQKHDKEFLKSLWKLGFHPSPLHMNGTTFIQSHSIVGCRGKGQKYQTFQSFWVPQCYAYIKFLGTWYFCRWEL